MKKALLLLCSLSLSVGIAACGKKSSGSGSTPTPGGTPSTTFPAYPPPMAQVAEQSAGGTLVNPVLVAVTYANDANRADAENFVKLIAASQYWTATTSEYGVGTATVGSAVELAYAAPASLPDSSIPTLIQTSAAGWATKPTLNTVYMMFYPSGTSITDPQFGNSCSAYGGYHTAVAIGSTGGTTYAVIPRCASAGTGFNSDIDLAAFAASHEIVEAVTDPYGGGYTGPSPLAGAWDYMSNDEELGDYCEWQPDQVVQEADMDGFPTQATWSNKAAREGHQPCQPSAFPGPYFNAFPVLTDTSLTMTVPGFGNERTPTVVIAPGKSATIELNLYSDADTGGPFTVSVVDYAADFVGQQPELSFKFDKTTGVNGENVHLTITVLKAGTVIPGGSIFVITAGQAGTQQQSVWPAFVSNG